MDVPSSNGGEGGIRTPDTVARMPHFECGAFNHSATSPRIRGASERRAVVFSGGQQAKQGRGTARARDSFVNRVADRDPDRSHGPRRQHVAGAAAALVAYRPRPIMRAHTAGYSREINGMREE